jgi:hypothetical protein
MGSDAVGSGNVEGNFQNHFERPGGNQSDF